MIKVYNIYTDGNKELVREFETMVETQQYLDEAKTLILNTNLQRIEVMKVVTLQGNQGNVEIHVKTLYRPKTVEEIMAIADLVGGISYEGEYHYVVYADTDTSMLGNDKPHFKVFTVDINYEDMEDFAEVGKLYVEDLANRTDVGFFKDVNF